MNRDSPPPRNLRRVTRLLVAVLPFAMPLVARAHCDAVDGPVVETARRALETGDVSPVLAWVRPADEARVRASFQKALSARKEAPASRERSDRAFFEMVVRVHRAGEGAPYTGLKPAGSAVSDGVRAADAAIAARDGAAVEAMLADAARSGARERFERLAAQQPPGADVAAGREWVKAYVEYIHYVERLETAVHAAGAHHGGGE